MKEPGVSTIIAAELTQGRHPELALA